MANLLGPSASSLHDITEVFVCSSLVVPCNCLAQTAPLIAAHFLLQSAATSEAHCKTLGKWRLRAVHFVALIVELAAWLLPLLAILASPNIESTFLILVICYAVMGLSIWLVRQIRSHTVLLEGKQQTIAGALTVLVTSWTDRPASYSVETVATTYARICSLLYTVLAIFCVDFPNFGERFMKTEQFGLTLMDIGIGCSLFSSGVSEGVRRRSKGLADRLVWGALPPLIIGAFRTGILSAIGYRVDSAEYGVHWNAFVSFGCITLLLLFCEGLVGPSLIKIAALSWGVLLGPVQWALTAYQDYLTDDDLRRNLVEANKEGIVSLAGFFAIFMGGAAFGKYVYPRKYHGLSSLGSLTLVCIAVLLDQIAGGGQGVLTEGGVWIFQPFSRRLGNLPYCMFSVGMNALFIEVQLWCFKKFIPPKIVVPLKSGTMAGEHRNGVVVVAPFSSKLNKHQLVYFVMANIVTGLVNIAIDTHAVSDAMSFVHQIGYFLFLGVILWGLP